MQEPEASLREVNLDTKHVIDRRESNAPRGVNVSAPRGCKRISVIMGYLIVNYDRVGCIRS
jgi:hypothetical protein